MCTWIFMLNSDIFINIIWVSRIRFSKERVLKRKVKGRLLQYCLSSSVMGGDFALSRIGVFTTIFFFKCVGYAYTYTSHFESRYFFFGCFNYKLKVICFLLLEEDWFLFNLCFCSYSRMRKLQLSMCFIYKYFSSKDKNTI